MLGKTNASSGGNIGGSTIIATGPSNTQNITCSLGGSLAKGEKVSLSNGSVQYTFKRLKKGKWTITASDTSGNTITKYQNIEAEGIYRVEISFGNIPSFTYSGNYELVNNDDGPISSNEAKNYKGNWKIRFLTTGNLKITSLNLWNGSGDLFLVGGGSSKGGSGQTRTFFSQPFNTNNTYAINIGGNETATSVQTNGALTQSAPGGKGLDGGSGAGGSTTSWSGNAHANVTKNFPGGSDGHSGGGEKDSGKGQRNDESIPAEFRTTTKEFGDETLPIEKAYSPANGRDGMGKGRTGPNSGAGGKGGQSGIVILRNSARV